MPLLNDQSRVDGGGLYPYRVSGVRFKLPRRLPLVAFDPGGQALAEIAVTSAPLPTPLVPEAAHAVGSSMWAAPNRVWFAPRQAGRAQVDLNAGLILDFAPDIDQHWLAQYFCANIISAILHLSRILPLHASCLVHPATGGAIALCAARGAGKSTLAAMLRQRGWQPLADDVTALAPNVHAVPQAWPGPPRFRLTPAAMAATGLAPDAGVPLPNFEKLLVETGGAPWHIGPAPLTAVIELADGTAERPFVQRYPPHISAATLSAHTFRRRLIGALGLDLGHAAQCLELTRRVPVFGLTRRRDLAQLGLLADAVEGLADTLAPAMLS